MILKDLFAFIGAFLSMGAGIFVALYALIKTLAWFDSVDRVVKKIEKGEISDLEDGLDSDGGESTEGDLILSLVMVCLAFSPFILALALMVVRWG